MKKTIKTKLILNKDTLRTVAGGYQTHPWEEKPGDYYTDACGGGGGGGMPLPSLSSPSGCVACLVK